MFKMLTSVLANVFSRPATRLYPFQRREPFVGARGHVVFDPSSCAWCGACSRRCPAAAITVNRQEKTLTFEPFRCIICEACVEVCPKKSITTANQYRAPAYAKGTEVYTAPPKPAGEEAKVAAA